jgi:poly-beta-1,6-N-acetyl-D-glucosamine synthase
LTAQRLLLISPVRNEAAHVALTIRSVAAQTRRPDLWLIVDDGSSDGTVEAVEREAADLCFVRIVRAPSDHLLGDNETRLVGAAEARAFNRGLRHVDASAFSHIGKLDGDIELPPGYFAALLREFYDDPTLGVAGGAFAERARGRWKRVSEPPDHVAGAVKLYTRECLDAIGGIHEYLGWDTIDETSARMRGFTTRARRDLLVRHHRAWGSINGRVRGSVRYGRCAYGARQPLPWVLLRSVKIAATPPFGVSGVAFLFGYVRGAVGHAPRVEDPDLRRFANRERRGRLRPRCGGGTWTRR